MTEESVRTGGNRHDERSRRWRLQDFLVDLELGELRGPKGPIKVEPKSLEVLAALCQRSGEVCTRQELIERVWRDRFVTEEVLTHCIWELRKALGDNARSPRFIKTVPRRGYRLLSQAEEVVASVAKHGSVAGSSADELLGPQTPREEPSVAVLPLVDFSADGGHQTLADGLSEELIFELSRCDGFKTVCRTSCFRFRNAELGLSEIGRQLGVNFLIEGSVRKSEKRVRVMVRLIEVATESERWSARYDRHPVHLIEVQEDVASRVAEDIAGRLNAPRSTSASMTGDAFESFLLGRYHFNQRSESSLHSALAAFERSRSLAPLSPRPLIALADTTMLLGIYGSLAPEEVLAQVETLSKEAIVLDPTAAKAFATLGQTESLYRWRWEAAERAFRRSIELDPEYSLGRLWLATSCLLPQGRFDEAHEQLDRAVALDPLDAVLLASRGILHYTRGAHELAEKALGETLELSPGFPLALQFRGLNRLMIQPDQAIEDLRNAVRLAGGSDETVSALSYGLAVVGQREEALRGLEDLEENARQRYVSPVLRAQVLVGLGDIEAAAAEVEEAFAAGAPELIWLPRRPTFASLIASQGSRLELDRLGLEGGAL